MIETRDGIARQIAEHTVDSLKGDGPKSWIEMLNLESESEVVSGAMEDVAKLIERRVRILPAYDKRDEKLGRHGVEMQFGLVNLVEKKAATLIVYTGWMPGLEAAHRPIAAELTTCRPATGEEDDRSDSPCAWLGVSCVSDRKSMTRASEALETLIKEGSEGLWKRLEELLR